MRTTTANWVFSLTILTASAFLMELCFTMITPFLPVYLVQELSVPQDQVNMWSGAIFSITFFISGLMGPVWGVLADLKSRKLMAVRASVCLAITYSLCGAVSGPGELFIVRFLQGLSAGLYPALLALVATSVPVNKIGLSMGLMQGGMTVGAIAGPFFGGVLADYFGMRPSFFVAGIALALVTLMVVFFVKEPPHKPQPKTKFFDITVLKDPVILRILFCSVVIYAAMFSIQPILPLYLADLNGSMDNIMVVAGTVFSICGISIMIAAPLIGMAGQKFGFSKVLIWCLVASGLLIMLQLIADTVEGFTFVRFLSGFAVAGLIPTVNSLLSTHTKEEDRGKIFGWNFLFGHVGMAGGPMLAGALAGFCGYAWVIGLSGFILLPLAVFLIFFIRNRKTSSESV